jgi:hypothetical protein
MHPHMQPLANHLTAPAALLRRSSGIDLRELATGAFCLVREHSKEGRPPGVVHLLGQHPSGQAFHVQLLHADRVVLRHNRIRCLVMKLRPLSPYPSVGLGQRRHRFFSARRSLDTPSHRSTLGRNFFLGCFTKPRVGHQGSVAHRRKRRQPHVDAYALPGRWQRFLRHVVADELGVPVAVGFVHHPHLLDLPLVGAVQLDLHLAQTVQRQPLAPRHQTEGGFVERRQGRVVRRGVTFLSSQRRILVEQAVAVARVLERERRVATERLEPWVARALARFDAAKEALERLVEARQGVLVEVGVDGVVLGAERLDVLDGLLLGGKRDAAPGLFARDESSILGAAEVVAALLEGSVVEKTQRLEQSRQGALLRRCRVQSIVEDAEHPLRLARRRRKAMAKIEG